MTTAYPETAEGSSNLHANWEVVDPEKWVPDGYVCIRVDARGASRGGALVLPGVKYTLTGVGPFLHEHPEDRPPEIFHRSYTLYFNAGKRPYVLLPVIPAG